MRNGGEGEKRRRRRRRRYSVRGREKVRVSDLSRVRGSERKKERVDIARLFARSRVRARNAGREGRRRAGGWKRKKDVRTARKKRKRWNERRR